MHNNEKQLLEAYEHVIAGWARTTTGVDHLMKPEDFLTTYKAWHEHKKMHGNPILAQRAYDAALEYLCCRDHFADAYWG